MAAAPPTFDLSGGALCLAFINTLGDRPRAAEEQLQGWPDLVAWGEQANLLNGTEAAEVRSNADEHPRIASRAFSASIELREELYSLFSAAAGRRPLSERSLASFNERLRAALAHAVVVQTGGDACAWGWAPGGGMFTPIEWPVLRSAADLLVSERLADVRECASATCSWMFLDRSPTRARRWCSMKGCGNRAKARRFYERHKAGS